MRMLLAAAAALAMLVSPALAGPDRVSILMGSQHVNTTFDFHETNPGVFFTWEDRGGFDLSVGAFRNSFGKLSIAATAALPLQRWRDGEISLFAGAALYPGNGENFLLHADDLVAIGGVQLRNRHLFAQIMPGDGQSLDAIVTLGITFPLGD